MGVTQKDIAARLNVSINTVSRSLRDMPDISVETKQRVVQAAEEMGYHKNLAAYRLRTNHSRILGVVVTDFGNPAISSVIRGAEYAARNAGYTLMLGSTNENAKDESTAVWSMLEQGVDGLLLIPSMLNEPLLEQIEQHGTPYVLALRTYASRTYNSVVCDDFTGASLLARHLCELGHKKFLYVAGLEHLPATKDRYAGLVSELKKFGLSEADVEVIQSNGNRFNAYTVMNEWLDRQPDGKPPVTAIVAFSDYVACGVYVALMEHNIRIPDDVSVVGFDNNEFSDVLLPSLTTIHGSYFEIGRRAMAHLLVTLRKQGDTEPLAYVHAPSLVTRSSSAPPRAE